MPWYYAKDNQRFGPYTEQEFSGMVAQGVVAPDMLVWRDGMQNWQTLREAQPSTPPPMSPAYNPVGGMSPTYDPARGSGDTPMVVCSSCNRTFPQDEVIQYQGAYICADCKPIFQQQLREGAIFGGNLVYAGFWIRFAARILDGLLMFAIFGIPTFILVMVSASSGGNPDSFGAIFPIVQFLAFFVGIAYETFFIGKYGATPGKMACGLRVVKADGSAVTYLRAFARYWAAYLSGLLLYIGYIIAAFDEEKRALHDHLCSTRVIRK